MKAIGYERENYSRQPRRLFVAGQCASQAKASVATKDKPEECGNRVDGQRSQPQREQRKEEHRDAVIVLAEGERVPVRIEHIRVEQVQRMVKRLMKVPPQRPGDHVRVALIGDRIAQVQNPGPRHHRRKPAEADKD